MSVNQSKTQLELPFPPTVNIYWLRGRTGQYLSLKARVFRAAVMGLIQNPLTYTKEVAVTITLHAPDKRIRDIDNYIKATLDALTHAGVWKDDSQVARLTVIRGKVVKGGLMKVDISPLDQLRSDS